MRVILFGGSGMVGQGVLRECVLDARVESVLMIVRNEAPVSFGSASASKVTQVVWKDFYDWSGAGEMFAGYDACFFCLGMSSAGMKEPEYRHGTYDLTVAAAEALQKAGVKTFVYVSGTGTNATGSSMWGRVKGETENALLGMGFGQAFMFRPGFIQPLHGIRSKTPLYNAIYAVLGWMSFLIPKKYVVTTEQVGKAMLFVAANGYEKPVMEIADIQQAAGAV
jgi:uncharacterized protein YbjT (DUF2867 family)